MVTRANVHDKHPLPQLLHGQEQRVYGDSAYASQNPLIRGKVPKARDFANQRTRRAGEVDEVARGKNCQRRLKSGPPAKVAMQRQIVAASAGLSSRGSASCMAASGAVRTNLASTYTRSWNQWAMSAGSRHRSDSFWIKARRLIVL